MGIPVLILGESGSGKSTALRNFSPEEISIFNVASKPLPFRKRLPVLNGATYDSIYKVLQKPNKLRYAIDDSQYLMAFEELDRARETGYTKFTEMALNFSGLIRYINSPAVPADCIVYFLHHIDTSDTGHIRAKTVGKMIDNKLTLEGLFSVVLLCEVGQEGHHFVTQSDGFTTAKSPMEMFPRTIDNDLKLVDTAIRDYWAMTTSEKE